MNNEQAHLDLVGLVYSRDDELTSSMCSPLVQYFRQKFIHYLILHHPFCTLSVGKAIAVIGTLLYVQQVFNLSEGIVSGVVAVCYGILYVQ